jgi:hypothetical protein
LLDCREGFITIFDCLALYAFNRSARRSCAVPHRGGRAADCLFGRLISVFGRFPSLFDQFISLFGHLGNLPHSLQEHQRLGSVDAVLEGRKIGFSRYFPVEQGKNRTSRPGRRSGVPKGFLIDLW